MRKLVLLLVIAALATTAFAAPKKATIEKTLAAPAPVPPSAPVRSQGYPFGIMAVSLNTNGIPAVRLAMGGWGLDVGGTIANAAGVTAVTATVRGEMLLRNISSDLRCYLAPAATLTLASNTPTTFVGNLFLGCEYLFAPHLSVFADVTALTFTLGNASTWQIGANGAVLYSGARLYL